MARLLMLWRFRLGLFRLALRMAPIAGASGEEEDEESAAAEEEAAEESAESAEEDEEDDASGKKPDAASEPNWKQMARKHEREAKKARKDREQLEQRLKAREDADKSEQEKAIEQAEQKARKDLQGEFDKERRQDRLEVATTKLAAKGLKIGSGDDAKTVRFADPEDALVHLERDIRNGDLDPEDIFDENGKVRSEPLAEALSDLLSRKPHLAASEGGRAKVQGSADGGKGTAPKPDSSVEDHLKKVRRHRDGQGASAPQYLVGRR